MNNEMESPNGFDTDREALVPGRSAEYEGLLIEIETELVRRDRQKAVTAVIYGAGSASGEATTKSAKKPNHRPGRPPKELTTRNRNIAALSRARRDAEATLPSVLLSSPSKSIQLIVKRGQGVKLRTWARLETQAKIQVAVDALYLQGRATTFNLQLGKRLHDKLAWGDPKTRAVIRDRILLELENEFGEAPPFVFVLEQAPISRRIHVHGVVGVCPEQLPRLISALKRAGGKWIGPMAHLQNKSKSVFDPHGWADYICKDLGKDDSIDPSLLVGRSNSMIQLARQHYEKLREFQRSHRESIHVIRTRYVVSLHPLAGSW